MQSDTRVLPANHPVFTLAALVFAAGAAGMAMSFVFLGSSHSLDVTAGAAGFVAGSVLVAAGWFCALGLAAATMLWINHAPGLKALGATRREFYHEVRRELSSFLSRLRSAERRE